MSAADDEIRILNESWRLLGDDVPTNLLDRGWRVADLEVGDEEPLEWFWPPTAPVGYGGLPEWSDELVQRRPQMYGRRPTPWTAPTRITRSETGWLVQYGAAVAQQPDPPVEHDSDAALLADLERVEWWPMPVEEARQISMERLWTTTQAAAHDQHVMAGADGAVRRPDQRTARTVGQASADGERRVVGLARRHRRADEPRRRGGLDVCGEDCAGRRRGLGRQRAGRRPALGQ